MFRGKLLASNSNLLLEFVLMLKLLQVMTRYISNPDNLKLMMNMLKEKSRNIQFEAFHVFKVWQYKLKFLVYVLILNFFELLNI